MAWTKYTMLFEARTSFGATNTTRSRVGGWSESWYDSLFSEAIKAEFLVLCEKRAALLPAGASVVGQRYQEVDPIGATSTGSRVFPGTAGLQADIPQMSLLLRIPGSSVKNFKPFYLRGLPDARVVLGEYSPASGYTAALTQFLDYLQGWNFRGRNLANAAVPILTISNVGAYQLEADSPAAEGDMVRVLRCTLANGNFFGGRFRIATKLTARTGTLADWSAGAATKGRMRIDAIVYPGVPAGLTPDDVVSRVVTRKVGRPFAEYSGRRSS